MTLLSATAIFLLDGPRFGSPDSLAYFVVMKRPVDPVSKMPMSARAWYLNPMMCVVSCVSKVCAVEMGSLKCTLPPFIWWLVGGMVWTGEVVSRMRWLAWTDVAILCVLALYAMKSLILVLSISVNSCLCLRRA